MPDLNRAIENHHLEMQKWWRVPSYIAARKSFVERNPVCVRCGRPSTTPGHSAEDYLNGFHYYLECVKIDMCEPLCNACNMMERKGRKPCPVCVKTKSQKIYYIGQHQEYCFNHRPEEEIKRSEERKEVYKMLVEKGKKQKNALKRKIYQEMKQNGRIR